MAQNFAKAAKSASNAVSIDKVRRLIIYVIVIFLWWSLWALIPFLSLFQKYSLQSTGIWERIRRFFALAPERSTGVPLNYHYRNPTPGGLPPLSYHDPVTAPAGDIADNPYWKRDVRRNYPKLSTVNQADVVGLLSVGSKAAPKDDVLQIGEAGSKQLVDVKQEGEKLGLAAHFAKDKKGVEGVLGPSGLPPTPCNLNASVSYRIDEDQAYPQSYVFRDL